MDWQAVLNIINALGLPTLIIGLALLSRQQRKLDAETSKTNAETAKTWQALYVSVIESLTQESERLTQDRDLGRERIRNQQAQIELLHEQKTAAIASNLTLTARLAMEREGKE